MTKRLISTILMVFILASILPLTVQATDISAGIVTTNGGNLNVRSAASSGSSVLAKMPNGSYLTLVSRSGAWWRVEYGKNSYGYCHADYITPIQGNAAAVQISSGSLNVRSGPGTSYGVRDRLTGGEYTAPPRDTMCGALVEYITTENKNFQPMGANMGILPPLHNRPRDKRLRYMAVAERAVESFKGWLTGRGESICENYLPPVRESETNEE